MGGVAADAADVEVEDETQRVTGAAVLEAEQELLVGHGIRVGEREERLVGAQGVEVVGEHLAVGAAEAGHEDGRLDRHPGLDPEHDRRRTLAPGGRHLHPGRDRGRRLGRAGQPERDVGPGRRRREHPEPDELEELDVVAVRDAVQPVQELIGHEREELDERDARVAHVVVGPLRGEERDAPLRLVDEVLERAVVEPRGGQGHREASLGPAEREDGSGARPVATWGRNAPAATGAFAGTLPGSAIAWAVSATLAAAAAGSSGMR